MDSQQEEVVPHQYSGTIDFRSVNISNIFLDEFCNCPWPAEGSEWDMVFASIIPWLHLYSLFISHTGFRTLIPELTT